METITTRLKKNKYVNFIWKMITFPLLQIKGCIKYKYVREKYVELSLHYNHVIDEIHNSCREQLRFGAYTVFDSTYGADGLFKLMLDSKEWKPSIVVIPDVSRGKDNMLNTYRKTKAFFINKYGEQFVKDGYDEINDIFIDLSSDFDVIYCANPYDAMVDKIHSIEYLSKQNCLPIYISYGYDVGRKTFHERLRSKEMNYVWRSFVDTKSSMEEYKKYQIIKGKNAVLTGYPKMDGYKKNSKKNNDSDKKRILISPHHTIDMRDLPLSNFLDLSEMIFELKSKYTNYEFVFRPHPLLFVNMVNKGFWDNARVDDYIQRLEKNGIEYSTSGEYMQVFDSCDAIIHDCGSFSVEWLITGKPACFVKNPKLSKTHLTNLMEYAISKHFIAKSKEDIFYFIDSLSMCCEEGEIDNGIMDDIFVNYPNSSLVIKDILEKELLF